MDKSLEDLTPAQFETGVARVVLAAIREYLVVSRLEPELLVARTADEFHAQQRVHELLANPRRPFNMNDPLVRLLVSVALSMAAQ